MSVVRRALGRIMRAALPKTMEQVDLGRYAQTWLLPRPVKQDSPYVPSTMIGHTGIDLKVESQLERLQSWARPDFGELWQGIRSDARINRAGAGQDLRDAKVITNGYYGTPDAEIYAAMIADLRPSLIVEVGGGFSTLVARHAIEYVGTESRLVVVDPQPRADVAGAADSVVYSTLEESDVDSVGWTENSILFIDSSHMCRVRGDVPLLYCRLLPSLPVGTTVHVHDVYLPWDYPAVYDQWLWSEQYLLHCLLSHTTRYELLLATHYLSRQHPAEMQALFGQTVGRGEGRYGASLWLRICHNGPSH